MDEAHLRRAPLHIFLKNPDVKDVVEVFKRNLDYLKENYEEDVLERFIQVYNSSSDGGDGLEPTFAHARDLAQISQAIRINQNKDNIDVQIFNESLKRHVLIVLQKMNIDIAQISSKTRTFRVKTSLLDETYQALHEYNPIRIAAESEAVIIDLENNITPVEIAEYLKDKGISVDKIDVIAESKKELRRTILG
jgi:predicted ATPase with chaperone activity